MIGDVAVREISTPVTNESYTRAVRGGAYGPAMTPEQYGFRRFRTRAPIARLVPAGAGVFGGGVTACLESGRFAARAAAREVAGTTRPLPRLRTWPRESVA